jgi:hypothetical protein
VKVPAHRHVIVSELHMSRSKIFFVAIIIAILAAAISTNAQAQDRSALLAKIESLRRELQIDETVFLLPSDQDVFAFRDFLQQPGTGLIRLMPREKYDGKMLMRGGGSYYSFTRLTNAYGNGSDLGFEQGTLRVGFAGADFGFLTAIGDVPVDSVTLNQPGVSYLAALNTPTTESEAREQQERSSIGFENDGFFYKDSLPVAVNTTYALRSTSYTTSDVLVAFRVTRQDADGSLILAWKMLKKFFGPIPSGGENVAVPAPPPRPVQEDRIHQELDELKQTEQEFLAPSDKDRAKNAEFLTQPDTGLIRLLPREVFQDKMTINGGAAYYSFARLTHEYGYGSDIELQQNQFSVGFAGADFGFLTRLGKVVIEEVTLDHPAAQFLSTFTAPTAEPGARDQQQRAATGFDVNGFTYKDRVKVKGKNSYLLRSIGYRVSDLLVAFRVVTQDDDGSVVIVWKILKKFPVPQLIITQASPTKL